MKREILEIHAARADAEDSVLHDSVQAPAFSCLNVRIHRGFAKSGKKMDTKRRKKRSRKRIDELSVHLQFLSAGC